VDQAGPPPLRLGRVRKSMHTGRMILIVLATALSACGLPDSRPDVDYESMFVRDRLVEWKISIDNRDWHELIENPFMYLPADVEVDGVLFRDAGLRLAGNINRSKVGMLIRFNEFNPAHRFHGVKRVNLRNNAGDPALVREALALRLMRQAGIPAPRASFVWVDWGTGGGVYTQVEQVDRRFLEDRFGEKDGNLYRVEAGGNLVYRGDDPADYHWVYTYELQTNEERADYRDLINLMKVLDQDSPERLERDLPRVLDVDGFLLTLAVNTWLSNLDSYAGSGRGYYLYHDRTGRFRFIPWDLNRAFGNYHGDYCSDAGGEYDCVRVVQRIYEEFPEEVQEYGADRSADLCAEHPRELCNPEFWEKVPSVCLEEPPPECDTCRRTTDELLALDPCQPTCNPDRPLVSKVLQVPAFRQRYHEQLRALIDGVLAPPRIESEMETMRALISDRARQDIWKESVFSKDDIELDFAAAFYADTKTEISGTGTEIQQEKDWEERVPGLLPFILARDELIRGALGGS
jgi:hypothetical protein